MIGKALPSMLMPGHSPFKKSGVLLVTLILAAGLTLSSQSNPSDQVKSRNQVQQALEQQTRVGKLLWDTHEVTVGSVRRYAQATGFVSQAENEGGGYIYEAGWTRKRGWTWNAPFGQPATDREPAVHLTFSEAQSICHFFGKRLPKDSEWTNAAYLEQRQTPPVGYSNGVRYQFPGGSSPVASHCIEGCGGYQGLAPSGALWRGTGHVEVMQTKPGVNGLWDMGGNTWEWVDTKVANERITRGGSWWYGPERQVESDVATKPADTRVGYIGFRCVQDLPAPAN